MHISCRGSPLNHHQGNTIKIAQRSMSAFMAVYIRDDSLSPYFADWHKHYNQNNR
ncbi:hypothetical protein BN1184_AH_00150 [Pantoea ananatis]|nr:hypothetical protein BN1184_AH_00150 [Pantoea ananatis]